MAAARGIGGDEVNYHGLYEGYTLTAVSTTKSVRILYVSTNSDAYPNTRPILCSQYAYSDFDARLSELSLHGRS